MARTDYYNDPNAPEPNSVVPSASAIVTDEHGRILLVKRRDNTLWALPRGGHDIGESIEQTAVREVKEETGLDVEVTRLQHLRMRLGRRRPAIMTSTVSASPAPRMNRCIGPLPPRLRLAQVSLSGRRCRAQ